MNTTTDKLSRLLETKAALKAALVEKGQNPGDVFSEYPGLVRAIQTDTIKLANIVLTKQPSKVSYNAFETFNPAGVEVKAVFSNDAYKFVTDFEVEPSEALQASDKSVKIKYTEFGVTAESEVAVTVAALKLGVPSINETFVYTGSVLIPTWSGYDSSLMSISGDTSGTNAGSYTVKFALKDKVNYTWADGTTTDKSVTWSIGKAQASITLDKTEVILNADNLEETVTFSSVGMKSVIVMSSDMSVATVSMEGNVITISSVNETTGTANIIISGEVNSNYNAPEYPSIEVSAEFTYPCKVKILYSGNQAGVGLTKLTLNGQEYSGSLVDFSASTSVSGLVLAELVVDSGTVIECVNAGNTSNAYNINGTSMDTYKGAVHSYTITSDILISMTSMYTAGMSFGTMTMPEISMSSITINEIGVVPSNYIALKSIESTGTQYIDTGYSAPEGFITEVDFEFTEVEAASRYIVGAHNTEEPYGRNGVGNNYLYCWEIGTGDTYPQSDITPVANTRYAIQASTVKGNSYLRVNGTELITSEDTSTRSSQNLLVFNNHYNVSAGGTTTKGKLYSLKIYSPDNVLVRDLVPVAAIGGGTAYLYDVINHKSYSNKGSDAFIAEYKEKVVTSIDVTTPPTKTQYQIGDIFDPTGMVVTATYTDNTTAVIDNYTIANGGQIAAPTFTSSSVSFVTIRYTENEVTVTKGYSVNIVDNSLYEVTIGSGLMSADPSYAYIEIDGVQYSGNPVTTLSVPAGTIAKCYTKYDKGYGSTSVKVDGTAVMSNQTGIYAYTIKSPVNFSVLTMRTTTEGHQRTDVSVNITSSDITLKTLQSIAVTTPPAKTQYVEGDAFDPTGMVVTATFDDGTTYNVTPYITITNGDSLSEAIGSVTISYTVGGVTATTAYEVGFSKPLISFTIYENGITRTYQAEEGMTWGEWVDSDYNPLYGSYTDKKKLYEVWYDMIHNNEEGLVVYDPNADTYELMYFGPNTLIKANYAYRLGKD